MLKIGYLWIVVQVISVFSNYLFDGRCQSGSDIIAMTLVGWLVVLGLTAL